MIATKVNMEQSTSSTQEERGDKGDAALAQLYPSLIHQVLLTDADDFSSLSSSRSFTTQTFSEFGESLDSQLATTMDRNLVLKKAVRVHMVERLIRQQPQDLSPLRGLLLELHQQVRALIPNRKDLHSLLDDDKVKNISTYESLQPMLVQAARSLVQLEAESRAATTRDFLHLLANNAATNNNPRDVSFWATAILYLLYKAELCQADKQDFYLMHVWAPRIHKEGPAMERKLFEERYGPYQDNPDACAATRRWIQSLTTHPQEQRSSRGNPQAQEQSIDTDNSPNDIYLSRLVESEEERRRLIRKGWVEDIVFRDSNQRSINMPEIFAQDVKGLQRIREVTRLAVAGCALALHARNAAAGPQQDYHPACDRKTALLKAMKSRNLPPQVYEEAVVEQVVALAQDWSAAQGNNRIIDRQSLQGRVVAVLRGEDPVLRLLNTRIKLAVRDVVLHNLHRAKKGVAAAPTELRTGLEGRPVGQLPERTKPHIVAIEKLFCQRGLPFFASELALVSERAGKIIDLAIEIFWEQLLNQLVLEQCNEAVAFALD